MSAPEFTSLPRPLQTESYLRRTAGSCVGRFDAGDYKQFFPLLFYKRLCDVFDEETQTALAASGDDKGYLSGKELEK
jgi:type I restriction enzyme M protein